LYQFSFSSQEWKIITPLKFSEIPLPRYYHTAVLYNDSILIFGGLGLNINLLIKMKMKKKRK
jgi:hypothetical protein